MPSGAKKRKAAKKKKEQGTNNSTNNNPQGENELKSIDENEKGSDGGEVDSPAHRDHDDHHQFNEVNEVVEVSEPSAAVSKSLEQVPNDSKIDEAEGGKESVSVIEWDVKSEESCENKDVSAVTVESAKELNCGNGKSGGSNNESITVKKSEDEPNNSVKETVDVDELFNSVNENVNSVGGSSAESAKESNYGNGKSVGSNNETGTVKNSKDEPYSSVKETVAVDDLVNPVKGIVNSVAGSSADSVKVITSVPEVKSRDTGKVLLEKSVDSQVGSTDLTVKRNEDKVHPFSDEDVRKSSLEVTKTKELDTNSSSSVSHCRIPESTNGVEDVKDSETPECSENQPLVAPQIVRKTSWLSCCGLFEVLSGSNR